jgi:hypothetical protein
MGQKEINFLQKQFDCINANTDWDWDDFSKAFLNTFFNDYHDSISELFGFLFKEIIIRSME